MPTRFRALSRRAKLGIVSGTVVVALLITGGAVWQSWPTPSPEPTTAAPVTTAPAPTPEPVPEDCLVTAARTSDAFDWWSEREWFEEGVASPDVQFLASSEAQTEAGSLKIVSSAPATGVVTADLSQGTNVLAGETVSVSLWAKATDGGENSVVVQLSPDGVTSTLPLPGGTYDWTQFTAEYLVPVGQGYFDLRLSVQGPTAGTWIDSVSVNVNGTAASRVQNSGFEANSGELTVTNDSLLFTKGEGVLSVATRRANTAPLHYIVRDYAGATVLEGDGQIANCGAEVDLASLQNGLFRVELISTIAERPVSRVTSLAVVDPLPASAAENSPFGVHMHYVGGDERISNLTDTLAQAGVKYARVEVPWDLAEKTPGVYTYPSVVEHAVDAFTRNGIEPLLVPAYYNPNYDNTLTPSSPAGLAAYANFTGDVAAKYSAIGPDIEVYNEFDHTFNNGLCGHTAACYMDMLTPAYAAAKAKNPDALVVAPGNSGMGLKLDWLRDFFELGGLQQTDVVSAHPYVQPEPPEQLIPGLESLRQMILEFNGGVAKPIWLSEMGWANVEDWVTEEEQSNYFVRTMAIALGHGVSRVYWFEAASLTLQKENGEVNFGMYEAPSANVPNANAPKMTAVVQAVMARQIAGRTFTSIDATSANSYSYVFAEGAESTRVMWATSDGQSVRLDAEGPVTVTDKLGQVTTMQPQSGVVDIALSGSPIYVSGTVGGVSGR